MASLIESLTTLDEAEHKQIMDQLFRCFGKG